MWAFCYRFICYSDVINPILRLHGGDRLPQANSFDGVQKTKRIKERTLTKRVVVGRK